MAFSAREINEKYLNKMLDSTEERAKVLYRIKEYWWPHFLKSFHENPAATLDALDLCMNEGQAHLRAAALAHADGFGFEVGSDEHTQRITQVIKSSTGKMFERLIALSISYALNEFGSEYCVWSFTKDLGKITKVFNKEDLMVKVVLGEVEYKTAIDADFVIFNPSSKDADYYLVSIKSTLKDRFHNVPFWNLLRHAAISSSMDNLVPENAVEIKRPKYIAICSDLAKEQPDFSAENGPRNMLCLDAALLDGAYVTASRAKGLGKCEPHIGSKRKVPFYPLTSFVRHLCPDWVSHPQA